MDLNLYVGLPRSPQRPQSFEDLGSVLALGSVPLPPSSANQEVHMASDNHLADPSPAIDSTHPLYSPRSENYAIPGTPLPPTLPEVEVLDAHYTLPMASALPTMHNERLDLQGGIATNVPYSTSLLDSVSPALSYMVMGESLDGLLQRQGLLEVHLPRLIDSHNQWMLRTFRSYVPSGAGRSSANALPITTEQLFRDVMSSQRSLRTNGKDKVNVGGVDREDLEEEAEEKSNSAANFECNICLNVAKEPVVTSCGHLFCWPCLYQWLHVYSGHRECPVCKGNVVEANITPIYGRGSSETDVKNKSGEGAELGLKIPPRPHGRRLESLRQQLQRPTFRSLGEEIAATWRHMVDEGVRRRVRSHGNRESRLLELYNTHRRSIAWMRELTAQWEEGNLQSGSNTRDVGQSGSSTSAPQISAMGLPFDDGANTWQRLSLQGVGLNGRLAAISADLGCVVERLGASTSSQAGGSASYVNPQDPEPDLNRAPVPATQASDQASASSTLAVIEGDVTFTAASAEPNGAGSSRSLRRRGSSSASSSLDVDGMLDECKRRRPN